MHDSTVATRQTARASRSLAEADGERGQVGQRDRPPPATAAAVFSGGAGRREQPRLGHAGLAERPERRAVEGEVRSRPDEPVRTSIRSRPVNVRDFPVEMTWPAAPCAGSILPSTQTLIQARPPLAVTTRLTPLYTTVTLRVRAVGLALGLRTR